MRLNLLPGLLALLLLGCQAIAPTPVALAPQKAPDRTVQTREAQGLQLSGTVSFPAQRQVQATAADVINAATVSLVDTSTNTTVATTVTNATGGFTLSLNGFTPAVNTPYLLDAVKGLNNHRPGNDAPRFRSFVMWDGAAWQSISTPAIVINAFTTAVAIISGLDSNNVPPSGTLGKVNVSVNPPGLNASPVLSGHPDAEILQLSTDITSYISGDLDPVASVNQILPTLGSLSSNTGKPTDVITLSGSGFSPLIGGNTVRFNGTAASVLSASPNRLIVGIPTGATTGNVTVQTTRGTSNGLAFTVTNSSPVVITGITPSQAGPGSTVTITGSGFSTTASQNSISFNGVLTTPSTASFNSLVTTVPTGANSGILTVSTPSGTSNPFYFTVPLWITSVFPDRSVKGYEVTVDGGNFGSSAGSVTFAGVGAEIRSWADTRINVTVPTANTGPVSVNAAGSQTSWPSFTMLAGNLGAFSNSVRTATHHQFGWVARIGRYFYVGGGYNGSGWDANYTSVERAPINADGTLGGFSTVSGVTMTNPAAYQNQEQEASVIGSYAYVFGGYNGSGPTAQIQRATIFSDGTISNFSAISPTLASATYVQATTRIGNYVYVIGGYNSGALSNIQRGTVNADGTITASFTTVASLPTARYGHALARIGNYLYMIGGYDGAYLSAILRAPINSDDTIGSFVSAGNLPAAFYGGKAVVLGNYLYIIWGHDGGAWRPWIYRAAINSDGTLGSFSSYANTGYNGVHRPAPLVVGSRLYIVGAHDGTAYVNSMEEATIQ